MQEITVQAKNQYGSIVYHPVCKQAFLFSKLTGTKTLTVQALKNIKEIGFDVKVIQPVHDFQKV